MTQLENLETKHDLNDQRPIKLTVELYGELLKRGMCQADIVRYTRQKKQNVSAFYYKHKEELDFIKDVQDNLAGNRYKRILYHAQERQLNILSHDKECKKVSASQCAVIGGIATQNYRLLSNQSTQNISIDTINNDLDELTRQAELIEARLEVIASRRITGNQEQIPAGSGEDQPDQEAIGGEIT